MKTSISITDDKKHDIVEKSQKTVDTINKQYRRGLITDRERYEKVCAVWNAATNEVQAELNNYYEKFGAKYYTVYYNLDNFSIYDDDEDITITNVDFAITQKTYADLFKDYVEKNVEGEITDHYARNGVKRSDFY